MAQNENEIVVSDFSNPETAAQYLAHCEQQIAFGCIQMATALKIIRDRRLYLLRECTSFEQYVDAYLPISGRSARRYLQIADAINEDALRKLEGASMKALLTIAGSPELAAEANESGSEAAELLAKAKARYERSLKEKEQVIEGKDSLMQTLRESNEDKDKTIRELQETVQRIAQEKGIDINLYNYVRHKKEAMALVEEGLVTVAKSLGEINAIPAELMDAELTSRITYYIAAVKHGLSRIEETFFLQLKTAAEIGILPEE